MKEKAIATFTLPHEIGHVLTNLVNAFNGHEIGPENRTNLMHNVVSESDALNATKRLTQNQDNRIHSQRPNLLA